MVRLVSYVVWLFFILLVSFPIKAQENINEKYKIIKETIKSEFNNHNFDNVIKIAERNSSIIEQTNDESNLNIHDIICLSYSRYISKKNKESDHFNYQIENLYERVCRWAGKYRIKHLPTNLIQHAYYQYKWDKNEKAIELFHAYLNFLELIGNNSQNQPIFQENQNFILIEDAQQALISIIYIEYINSNKPKNLKVLFQKYPNIISEIMDGQKGEYYNDFIKTCELAMKVYNERNN